MSPPMSSRKRGPLDIPRRKRRRTSGTALAGRCDGISPGRPPDRRYGPGPELRGVIMLFRTVFSGVLAGRTGR